MTIVRQIADFYHQLFFDKSHSARLINIMHLPSLIRDIE